MTAAAKWKQSRAGGWRLAQRSGMRLTSNHVAAVARQLQQRVMGNSDPVTAIETVASEEFDNRNDHPVIPLRETDVGGAWDLTTGHSIIGTSKKAPLGYLMCPITSFFGPMGHINY